MKPGPFEEQGPGRWPADGGAPPQRYDRTALRAVADHFVTRPHAERLVARVWLPRRELAAVRSFTRLRASVREFDHDLARARDATLSALVAGRLDGDPVLLRDAIRERTHERHRDRALDEVLDRAALSASDLGFGPDFDRARDRVRECDRALALADAVERALFVAVTAASELALGRAVDGRVRGLRVRLAGIDRDAGAQGCAGGVRLEEVADHPDFLGTLVPRLDVVRAAVRDVALARDRDAADVLTDVLGQARDLALDQARDLVLNRAHDRAGGQVFGRADGRAGVRDDRLARALADALGHGPRSHDEHFDADLADAADLITDAAADAVDADLAHVALDGIPLEGLRWSAGTRWHHDWQALVRRSSVELRSGLYEVRAGTAEADDVVAT